MHNFVYMARLGEFKVVVNFAKVLALGLSHFSSLSGPLSFFLTHIHMPASPILNPY